MSSVPPVRPVPAAPRPALIVVAMLVALACLGFAAANLGLMFTDALRSATYRRMVTVYPAGLAVMNWLVFGLKLAGAGLALATIRRRPPLGRPAVLGTLLWGAFITLAVYATGNILQTIGLATGLTGDPGRIDMRGLGYVLFFVLFATGFGILAVGYQRRFGIPRRAIVLGVVGAPALLGLVLFVVPTLLASRGLLPG